MESLIDDESYWEVLWNSNRAVAQAYGLSSDDLQHILGTFPTFARKRPEFLFLVAGSSFRMGRGRRIGKAKQPRGSGLTLILLSGR